MAVGLRKGWLVIALAALAVLLAWAWVDGGERPLADMRETVVLPGASR